MKPLMRLRAALWQRYKDNPGNCKSETNRQGTGGFTLVELIVTLIVLGILLTLGLMSLSGWQDHADFKKQNEYAQDIFAAAQIQLTQYAERGQLTELINAVTGDRDPGVSRDSYVVPQEKLAAETKLSWQDGNEGTIFYLKVKKGNYEIYQGLKGLSAADMKKQPLENRRIRALYDLIDPYIADKSMLDAAICIEFDPDPKSALVYSVFYNEKVEEFTYDSDSGAPSEKTASLADRREAARKKDKTGYYGAEVMSRGTDTHISRPVITNLRLNNGDTLNLSWSTKGNGRELTKMVYNINLMEPAAEGGEPNRLLSLVLGSVDEEDLNKLVSGGLIRCAVTYSGETASKEYDFPLVHNVRDNTLTLVLDGLDLGADETQSSDTMKETASIRRFGLTATSVYASITGSRPGEYALTVEKKSNMEDPLFASRKTAADGTVQYFIDNARQLNNIRYAEYDLKGKTAKADYRVTKDISWEYALNTASVYDKGQVQIPEKITNYYFKPFLTLRANSTLESDDAARPRTLRKFRVAVSHMNFEGMFMGTPLGLVCENAGTIQNLILEDIYVNGIGKNAPVDNAIATGAVCGINTGRLAHLTLRESGTIDQKEKDQWNLVAGELYVGGFAGQTKMQSVDATVSYEYLESRIAVTGQMCVGGIAGSLGAGPGATVFVRNCSNYGKVQGGIQTSQAASESWYIGGIVGDGDSAEAGGVTLENCVSLPSYTEKEAQQMIEMLTADTLEWDFVGGIIGRSKGVSLTDCGTLRESAEQNGYVIGRNYVGGIAGYYTGNAGELKAGAENGRNQAHIIGHSNVGGVVGSNKLDNAAAAATTLVGWINEGMVVASGDYAGGIIGYNGRGGVVDACYSSMPYGSGDGLQSVSGGAKYVGGVAGYNAGKIYSSAGTNVYVTSAVSGDSYVGGVVGLNDKGAEISNYVLRGGSVKGTYAVGGFVGMNMSRQMFTTVVQSNPNSVSGKYFVGGIIGANLVPVGSDVSIQMGTNNFLGSLTADGGAFAGGFIGYNCLLGRDVSYDDTFKNTLVQMRKNLDSLAADGDPRIVVEGALSDKANSEVTMTIRGSGAGEDIGQGQLGGISGNVYVGGIVGDNHSNTKLIIQDIVNITPVRANGHITKQEGDNLLSHDYAYAGGIIGLVSERVTIDNCRNSETGEVVSEGTYHGGLVEVNYGTVKNCQTGHIGDGSWDYVGGLVGVNASKDGGTVHGSISNCVINGSISGKSYVGGLAAENFGLIEYNENVNGGDAEVSGSGYYVGGITGYAHKGGTIALRSSVALDINIGGDAAYVGGIAGTNEGTITTDASASVENHADNTITGRKHVGGFIGVQIVESGETRATISGLHNRAYVQATSGYAGGIVATVTSRKDAKVFKNVKIASCENHGIVEVLQEDDDEGAEDDDPLGGLGEDGGLIVDEEENTAAGGITAINRCVIEKCGNYGEISTDTGYLGGIAAVNYHEIRNSEVGLGIGENHTMTIVGTQYVGGVTAINRKDALIEDCAVKNLILNNQSDSTSGYMGGVTAWNQGEIVNAQVGVNYDARTPSQDISDDKRHYASFRTEAAKYAVEGKTEGSLLKGGAASGDTIGMSVVLVSYSPDVAMGGVAGLNDGTISGGKHGADADYSAVAADLRFRDDSINYYGNLGGIAGVNSGTVERYEFSGYVMGHANDSARTPTFDAMNDLEQGNARIFGYGGIVGMNGNDKSSSSSASVKNCYLGVAKIRGTGAGSNPTIVGGVAGFNGMGATIEDITFGAKEDLLEGENTGNAVLPPFEYKQHTSTTYRGTVWVAVENLGYSGGVAGYNHGSIRNINWSQAYSAARELPQNAAGGYYPSGVYTSETIAPVDDSYALITSAMGSTGGIVGYNRRTGLIYQAVTGRNWLIHTDGQEQNSGTGGIIGYNISERDLERCDNHARVAKLNNTSNAVGGMTGRMENATTSSWRFYDCRNYGTILATARAGGMIGNWKYKGGTLENCRNYGVVDGKNEAAGGIVAYVYGVLGNETVNVVNCESYGTISCGTTVGGIVGGVAAADGEIPSAVISGCVNTGSINGSGAAAGILGRADSPGKTHIIRCRNYGYSTNESGNFCGIVSTSKYIADVKECFGVTGSKVVNPISNNEAIAEGNYSFSTSASDAVAEDFWVDGITAIGAASNTMELYRFISGALSGGNFYFKESNTSGNSVVFRFNQPVYLDRVEVEFAPSTDSEGRRSSYNIEFWNENEEVSWIEDGESSSTATQNPQTEKIGRQIYRMGSRQLVTEVRIENFKMTNNSGKNKNALIYKFEAFGSLDASGDVQKNIIPTAYTVTTRGTTTNYTVKRGSKALTIKQDTGGNYVVDEYNQTVIDSVGAYTQEDILNPTRAEDAKLSYKLCKGYTEGTTQREGLDPYLILNGSNVTELETPENLGANPTNGSYKLEWDPVLGAQYYTVTCTYAYPGGGSGTATYVSYSEALMIPSNVEQDGKKPSSAVVKVVAHNGSMNPPESEPGELEITFGKTLPTPQVAWRLDGLNADGRIYRVELLNQADYVAFIKENLMNGIDPDTAEGQAQIQTELAKISINTGGFQTVSFSAKDAAKRSVGGFELYSSDNFKNKLLTAKATYTESKTDVVDSYQNVVQTMVPPKSNYDQKANPSDKMNRFATVALQKTSTSRGIGFTGTTESNLIYQMSLARSGDENSPVSDFRSELIAKDPDLGVPVAFSVSEQTRISPTTGAASIVKLGNLPADFLSKDDKGAYRYQHLMVRTYPTKMQGDAVYQGWNIGGETTYTADELEDVKVTDNGQLGGDESLISGGRLRSKKEVKPGYVLVWSGKNSAGESLYKIYYNSLLKALETNKDYSDKEENTPGDWKYQNDTFMRYQVFYYFTELEKEIEYTQPMPILYADAVYDTVSGAWKDGNYDGTDEFVLTWDMPANVNDNKPGYPGVGAEGDYQNAVYQLTLIGMTGDQPKVLVDGAQITPATRDQATYVVDKSRVAAWNYNSIVARLTRVGEVDSNNVIVKSPSTIEKTFKMRKRLTQPQNVTASLARDQNNNVLKDNLDYDISFTGVPKEEESHLAGYEIVVSSLETVNPTPELRQFVPLATLNPDSISVPISLAAFRRSEKISITAQAVAKDEGANSHTGYRDSLVSPSRDMTVPSRLRKPEMGAPTAGRSNNMEAFDLKESLAAEDFMNGAITLHMKEENYSDVNNVDYRIALSLYDSKADAEDENKQPLENTGLPTKEAYDEMQHMTGGGYYTYTVKRLSTEYAGKWMKVVLQSANSSSISSVWTDEANEGDPDDTCTSYMLFKLPDVQVEAVEITAGETEWKTFRILEDGQPIGTEVVEARQIQAEFDLISNVDGYRIHLIQIAQLADSLAIGSRYEVSDVAEMTLKKDEGDAYKLTYWSTEGADEGPRTEAEYLITVDGESVVLPYRKAIRLAEGQTYYIQTEAVVTLSWNSETAAVHVEMQLPDCSDVKDENSSIGPQIFTEQLLVQSVANRVHYLDSKWGMFAQTESGEQSFGEIEQAEKAVEPEDVETTAVAVSNITNVAYTCGLSGATRYIVEVCDASGKDLGTFAVPVLTSATVDNVKEQQVWFPAEFAKHAGKAVTLRFRSIFDVSNSETDKTGGFSEELSEAYSVTLPEASPVVAAQAVSALADSQTYKITQISDSGVSLFGLKLGGNHTKTIDVHARQKQLTWDYDLRDRLTVGYQMEINGAAMEEPYKLELDLHRGLFGTFPGLKDYLTPEGKTLYEVSYSVDGDMVLKLGAATASASNAGEATTSNATAEANGLTASHSNMATTSNKATTSELGAGEPGYMTLACTLRAEYVADGTVVNGDEAEAIRFILTLPDAAYDYMPEEIVEFYAEGFADGLYQSESFRLSPVAVNRAFRKEDSMLDLTELRGELENDTQVKR